MQQLDRDPQNSFGQPLDGGPAVMSRVVSIRAHAPRDEDDSRDARSHRDDEEDDGLDRFHPAGAEDRGLSRMANALHDIVEGARTQSLSLQSSIEQASALDEDIAAASRQLHERLSLSARMLKAFQSQIDRIDGLLAGARAGEERVAALNERMQERVGEFETRLERYLERFDARLEEMVGRASTRFRAQIAEHEESMAAVSAALPDLDERLGNLQGKISTAEVNTAAAEAGLHEALDNASEAQAELKADAERSMEIASNLKEQWLAAGRHLEDMVRAAAEAAYDLESRSARASTLLPALKDLEQIRSRLSTLLSRLEPLLPIIQDEERFAAARVRHAADLMRTGLRKELSEIAGTFRRLAEDGLPPSAAEALPVAQPAPVPLAPAAGAARPHRMPSTRTHASLVEVVMRGIRPSGAD